MPWTVDNPPSVAKNWTDSEKRKCVSAANAVLSDGGSDKDAIFACIHAAGKSKGEKSMKCGMLYREAEVLDIVERAEGEEDSRTVRVAFSSEAPVERYFGTEILDHKPESVRLGRLKNRGAVLVDHNREDHVGVVESISIDSDLRGRADLRFGKSERATEIFNDVVDGIRGHVSVGYRVHEWIENKDGEVRVTDWEPMEISLVSIPADVTVGVGRADSDDMNDVIVHRNYEETPMPDPKKDDERKEKPVDTEKIAIQARSGEVSRIREISALAKRNGFEDLGEKFIDDGKSVDEFRAALLDKIEEQRKIEFEKRQTNAKPASQLDMSEKEVQRYSLLSAIRAHVSGNWKHAEFERECSEAVAKELNREANGFFVPFDVQLGKRVMNVGSKNPNGLGPDNVGSDLVGTDHLAGSFIDFLYTRSVVYQAGATALPGLVGNVDIPKQAGTTTFHWLTEDEDATDDDIATGTVSLAPTTIAGSVPMTRRLMKQSAPSVEGLVLSDLARGAALAIDLATIEGSGVGAIPTGVVNQTGVQVNTLAVAGQPTWAELVNFETLLDNADALMGGLAYITTPAVVGHLKTTPKESGQAIYLADSDRRSGVSAGVNAVANGYDVRRRTGLTANRMVFGNWADVLIGMWGVLDVMPDPAAKAASGGLIIRVFQDVDVAVRHGESFSSANVI